MTIHQRRPGKSDVQRIRMLFEQRQPSYSIEEAAKLLGIPSAEIRRELEKDAVTPLQLPGEARIGWSDVVLLGLVHRWSMQLVTEALQGSSAEALLPPLVQTTPGTLILPRYQWKVLDLLASECGRTERRVWSASDVVEEALRAFFIEGDWERLEAREPGIRAALEWPASDLSDVAK